MTGDNRIGISVCMITKNEEKNLLRSLGSIEDIADEIIIVDTGSTDKTIKIAKSFNANVIEFPWSNNFSEARNIALEAATCQWILLLDADEALDIQDSFNLRRVLLENPKAMEFEGFCLQLTNLIDGKKTLCCTSLRIIKNRKEYRFRGRIHEQIYPSMEERSGKGCVQILEYKLYHYGYDKDESNIENKIKRNFSIFNSYTEEEKDAFFYYNFANEYLRSGDLNKALENYLISERTEGYDNGFRLFLPIYIVKTYYDMNIYDKAIEIGEKYLAIYPNYKDLLFVLSACYYNTNNYVKSKEMLLNYILYSKEDYGYPEFYFNNNNNIEDLLKDLDNKINSM